MLYLLGRVPKCPAGAVVVAAGRATINESGVLIGYRNDACQSGGVFKRAPLLRWAQLFASASQLLLEGKRFSEDVMPAGFGSGAGFTSEIATGRFWQFGTRVEMQEPGEGPGGISLEVPQSLGASTFGGLGVIDASSQGHRLGEF